MRGPGPAGQGPGGAKQYTPLCGARVPVRQELREVKKHTQMCGVRGPAGQGPRSTTVHVCKAWGPCARGSPCPTETPGGTKNTHSHAGPGGPQAMGPGRSTNIHRYVGHRGPNSKDPGGSARSFLAKPRPGKPRKHSGHRLSHSGMSHRTPRPNCPPSGGAVPRRL